MRKHVFFMLLLALLVPWAARAQETVTIGTGTSTTYYVPFNSLYGYSFTEQVFPAEAIGMAGNISAIRFYLGTSSTAVQTNDIVLYMKNVSRSSFSSTSDYEQVSTSDVVYSGQWTIPANYTGWVEIELDNPFAYDGASNLMVAMHEYTSGYSTRYFTYTSATNSGVSFYSDSYNPDPYNISSYSGSSALRSYLSNIQLDIMAGDISCYPVKNLSIDEITDESMTLSWIDTNNAGATYTVYSITATDTTVLQSGISDTFYAVTDLSASTNYRFGVQTDCGAGDLSSMRYVEGRTACGAIPIDSLPYTYGFEDASSTGASATFDPCYGRYTNYSTAYPYPSSTQKHSGTYSLYFYSTASYYSYTTLPLFEEDFSNLMLSFWAYRTGANYGHWAVGIMSDPSDITTFDTIAFGQVSANSTWELIEVPLNGYTGEGNYIAIMSPIGSAASYIYVDDINVGPIPSCVRPLGVAASDITTTSATITINDPTENGSYMLWYGADSVEVIGMTYDLTDLEPSTTYQVTVKGLCGDGTTTNAVYTSFTTLCENITEIPWSENFDSLSTGSAPNCWTVFSGGTTGVYSSSTQAHSGTQFLRFIGATPNFVAMPMFEEPINGLQVRFWTRPESYTNTNCGTFSVGYMTDASDTSTFVPLETYVYSDFDSYEEEIVSFAAAPDEAVRIAFRHNSGSTSWYWFVDDIVVEASTGCPRPASVVASDVTAESATISWVDPTETGSYVVTYQVEGSTEEPESLTVSDTTVDLTELTPNTVYVVNVMTDCSGELSAPRTLILRSGCAPMTVLPWTEDFENVAVGTGTSHDFVPCMNRLNNGTSYFGYPYVGSSTSYNHTPNGMKGLYWYNTTTTGSYGDYQIVVLPEVDADAYAINTLQVRFWAKPSSTTSLQFQVGVMTDPANDSTFELMQTVNVAGSSAWTEYTVPFGTYTGEGRYVAIKAVRASWTAYVDDITLELMPTCPAVIDVAATPTASSAILTWDYMAGYNAPSSYIVTYDSIGGTSPTTVIATTNSTVITGLEPHTSYKVYVQADCGEDNGVGIMDSVEFVTGPSSTIDFAGGTSTSYYLPIGNYFHYSYTQQLITAEEMGNLATQISGIEFEYAYGTPMTDKTNVTIYLANTDSTSLSSAFIPYDSVSFVPVYSGSLNCTQGWNHFQFTTPFNYNGTSNLLIVVHDNSDAYDGTSYTFKTHSATGKGRYVQNDSNPYSLNSITGGTSVSYRANMKLHYVDQTGVTCVAPAVVASNATGSTVDLIWAPGNDETSWDVDYRLVGDSVWTNAATGVSTNSYTVTGLNDGMVYQFRVSFTCADNNTLYVGTTTATTVCAPKTLPYTENFDNVTTSTTAANPGEIPMCWDYVLTGSSTYQGDSYRPGVYYNATYATSGSYSLRLYGVGYHMLPEVNVPLDSVRLTFSDYITGSSYGLIVGVMEGSQFVPVDTVALVANEHNDFEVLFNNYHGTSRTIAFCNYYSGTSTYYYSYHYIDDIVVDYIPGCTHVNNLEMSAATETSITLHWLPGGQETQWEVSCSNGTTVVANDTTATFTGLNTNTPYTFEVRSICGIGDTSEAATLDARTACGLITNLPWMEDFNSFAATTTATEIPCWDYIGTGGYVNINSSSTYSHGGNCLRFYPNSSSSSDHVILLPEFADDISGLELTFWTRPESASNSGSFSVGYVTDPAQDSTFVEMLNIPCSMGTTITQYEVIFAGAPAGSRIAMRHNVGSTAWYWFIDDVDVHVAPTCVRPTDIEVSDITDNSATITVVDPNSANNYRVYVTGNGTTDSMIITSATAMLSGLSSATNYTVSVLTICDDGTLTRSISTDFTTALCSGAQIVATGDPDSTTSTTYYAPVNNYFKYTLSETIIDSAELGGPMEITSIAYYYNYTSPTTVKTDVTIWLQPTNKSEFTSTTDIVALDSTTAVMVYQGNLNCAQGWNYFGFTTPYNYDGNGNLLVIVDDNSNAYNGTSYTFKSMATTEYKTMSYYSDSYDADPLNPGSYSGSKYRYQWRPVMQLISCGEGCPAPTITSVVAGSDNVTVAFTADGTVEAAIVEGATFNATTGTVVTGNTYTFTGLDPLTEYTFGLRTLCEDGATSSWVTRTVTTDSAVCFVPTNVTVSATTFDGATITWTAGGEETAWEVHVYNNTFDQTYTANTNTLSVSGLNEGTFNVTVRALCSATNSSEWSEPIQFTTESCVAPTAVTVSNITANSAVVSWTAAASGNGNYTMEYGFSGFSRGQGTTVEVTGTTYTITGLESEIEYDVYVASYCGENIVSPWTPVQSFTTIAGGETYTITVQSNNPAWGTVTGGGVYPAGTSVTLTATPTSDDYRFDHWQDGNNEATRTIVVTADATYTATFVENIGIEDVEGNAIMLYPNPASSNVTISGMETQASVMIVDMNGREVYRATAIDGSVKIDVSGMSKGAYFVRITGEKTNAIRKLVVK